MKLVNRGLALLLAAALAIPSLPVNAVSVSGNDTKIVSRTEETVSQNDLNETKDPVSDKEDKQDELDKQENVGGEQETEKKEEKDSKESEKKEELKKKNAAKKQEERIIPDRAEEVKVNTGNFEFTVVDTSVSANAIGDTYFDQDGNYTINIPEANPFFPYEVQFNCDGEVTTEWFMTPDDSVEIGGHTFYVSAYFDGTVVTQMSLNVAGKTVIVYPERKEFTNDGMGAMPASLLPLEEIRLDAVDLTGFTPVELTQVSVTSILGDKVSDGQNVVWQYRDDNDNYVVSSYGDKIDLSYHTNSGGTTWEMIVGSADQLDASGIRYYVEVDVTNSRNWLSTEVYIQNEDGTRSQVTDIVSDNYNDYSKERYYYKWMRHSQYDSTQVYYKLGVNSEVFGTPHYASYKIFKGNYSNASETASAEDITAKICSDTGYNFASGYEWLTMVTYDAAGKVTGCLPFELRAYIETPSRYTDIDTDFYTKETNGTMSRVNWGSSFNDESGYTEYELYHGKPVNDIYYCKMRYEKNGTIDNAKVTAAYVGEFNSVKEAQAAGAKDVKDALFGTEGYPADYSQGVKFSIFVGNTLYRESAKVIETLYSERDVAFIGVKDAKGNELPFYIAEQEYYISSYGDYWNIEKYHDSYGEYNFITMLVDSSVDLSQKLAPVFTLSEGAKLYTAGSSTEEISGVSSHLFNNGPVQYTCSAEDGENARNYWLQILKAEMGGKLYINSLEDEMSKTREENGVIYSTREVMLDGYHDYIHDILLINKGMDSIPALSAELISDVVELDEYWTLKGTHELKGFKDITAQGEDKLSNQAKIRIKAKEGVTATEVSGTLTIKSNGKPLMVLNLTGTLGDPTIITKDIPEAVKYVPYGTMIQNNNKYSWNKVSYYQMDGKLPKGMRIKSNGEIYGVPQETGTFTFTVRMNNSGGGFEACTKEFTLTVIENTDINVDNATDTGYDLSQRVQNIYWDGSVSGEQTMVSEGIYGEFVDIYLDGKKLVEGTDYTSESGSTRITILNQTLAKSGETGTHTLGVEFRTQDDANVLKRAAQNYVVTTEKDNSGNTDNGGDSDSNNDYTTDNGFDFELGNSDSNTANNFNNLAAQLKENAEKNKANAAATESISYTVQAGDTLWKIAVKYFGDGNQWRKILEDNKATIADPNRIYVGQVIVINVTANSTEAAGTANAADTANDAEIVDGIYTVQAGDTMWKISKKVYGTGIFWRRLFNANKETIKDASRIYVGQTIKIP